MRRDGFRFLSPLPTATGDVKGATDRCLHGGLVEAAGRDGVQCDAGRRPERSQRAVLITRSNEWKTLLRSILALSRQIEKRHPPKCKGTSKHLHDSTKKGGGFIRSLPWRQGTTFGPRGGFDPHCWERNGQLQGTSGPP